MNLSGILIIFTASKIEVLTKTINAMPDVEVYHIDRDNNKLIVVQEGDCVRNEVDGLKKIKKLPGVVLADMVYHYFADDESMIPENMPDDLDEYTGMSSAAVPAYLND